MQEELLSELWYKYTTGVPICLLIKQYNLSVTPPTLTKLMKYVDALETCKDEDVQSTIYASLFPEWLTQDETVKSLVAPNGWKYKGVMPLGEWVNLNEKETI